MINPDKRKSSPKEEKEVSSLDQALLDEFFSVVASIVVRLTKDESHGTNCDDYSKGDVSTQ